MIARKNPGRLVSGKLKDVADSYGLTPAEFSRASLDFLECEGYIDGHECQDLHEYLTYEPREVRDLEYKPDFD